MQPSFMDGPYQSRCFDQPSTVQNLILHVRFPREQGLNLASTDCATTSPFFCLTGALVPVLPQALNENH